MKQKLAQRRSEGRVCLCLGCERTNKKEGSNNLSRGGARMSLVRCGGLCSRCQARKRKKKERREQASACLMCLWRVFLFVWLLLLNCQVQKIIENRCQLSPISQTGSAFPGVVRKRKETGPPPAAFLRRRCRRYRRFTAGCRFTTTRQALRGI